MRLQTSGLITLLMIIGGISRSKTWYSVADARDGSRSGSGGSQHHRRKHVLCGGELNGTHGVIQTPGFPGPFPTPIRCLWIIDASSITDPNTSINIYFTQLYVFTGLKFYEYADYKPEFDKRLLYEVTEEKLTRVRWIKTPRPFLGIEFELNNLESNHLRVLDDLLDVYGFNITYEVSKGGVVNNDSCTVTDCSFTGNCYVDNRYKVFSCSCFNNYSGPNCGQGPLCLDDGRQVCQNGGVCKHVGAAAVSCHCTPGFTGEKCEVPLPDPGDSDCPDGGCVSQCSYDERSEHVCDCPRGGPKVSTDKVRFEGTVRVANLTTLQSSLVGQSSEALLKALFEKYITRYLKNLNLSKMDELKVLKITNGEVTFHFFGDKNDSSRVREAMNKLVEKGRLGNLTLVPTHLSFKQESTLLLQSLHVGSSLVREGDEIILSCLAQGSSYMEFRYYKDGVLVNVTKATSDHRRTISMDYTLPNVNDQKSAILVIHGVTALDAGTYTCQVMDWGIQQCKSVHIGVKLLPQVKVSPMSVTVQKGDNITIQCVSSNDGVHEKFGYGWRKNDNLLKMIPAEEVTEDLYPTGSILKIYNAQKSATYKCSVNGDYEATTRSIRVEVVNRSLIPLCPEERFLNQRWPETAPGVESIVDCPAHLIGNVSRLCTLRDTNSAAWELPNYATCFANDLISIHENFRSLTYGYQNTSGLETLQKYLNFIRSRRGMLYPNEGERFLTLITEVMIYINKTGVTTELDAATRIFYAIIDLLLGYRHSITNQQKVAELQQLVRSQALVWGSHLKSPDAAHVQMTSLVLDVASLESPTRNIRIPLRATSYPAWFTDKVDIHIESGHTETFGNDSFTVAVTAYKNISGFLPMRYSTKKADGTDLQFEIISRIINIELGRASKRVVPSLGLFWVDLELQHVEGNYSIKGWNATCGVTDVATNSPTWAINSCTTRPMNRSFTKCTCNKPGTYAVLWTYHQLSSHIQPVTNNGPKVVVLTGCVVCLAMSLLSLCLLLPYWWQHRSCLIYLKLQCCAAISGAMVVFVYAIRHSANLDSYEMVATLLELFLLIGMSSHLSKLLIVYTEVVPIVHQVARVNHLHASVVGVITGVPVIAVLINYLAHRSLGRQLNSWWLITDTMMFVIFVATASLMVFLFIFLYFSLMRKLRQLVDKHLDKTKALHKRIGLLCRAAVIFFSVVAMEIASIFYINLADVTSYYAFSISSVVLGITIFTCYILKCESSLRHQLLRKLKFEKGMEEDYSSESVNSPLSFFTKQDGEVETDSAAPPRIVSREFRGRAVGHSGGDPTEGLLLSESCTGGFYRYPEQASSTIETYVHSSVNSSIDAYNDLDASSHRADGQEEVDLERYQSSPKKYKNLMHIPPVQRDMYSEYVEQDTNPKKHYPDDYIVRNYYPDGDSDSPITRPAPGKCYIRDVTLVPTPEMMTTRVCVELGLVKSAQHNSEIVGAEASISVETPSNVLCSVDVEPVHETAETSLDTATLCNGKDKTKPSLLDQDDSSTTESSSAASDRTTSIKSDNKLKDGETVERKQPEGREKSVKKAGEDNLDGMLDRISHDLDYLLNRTTTEPNGGGIPAIFVSHGSGTTRKTSKPPATSVRGQIREEDEEIEENGIGTSAVTTEDDSDIGKTIC